MFLKWKKTTTKKIKAKWMKKSIVMKSNEIYMCLEFLHSFFETDDWCFIL